MKKKKLLYWRICVAIVLLLVVFAYTPLMIPEGKFRPMLAGIPYSLWLSFVVTAVLVLLTFIGSRVHPGSDNVEDEE